MTLYFSRDYQDFVPNYASYSYHLTEATRKSAPDSIVWNDHVHDDLCYLQPCLCSPPCLCIPLPSDSFCLQTDAPGLGIGAVLSVNRDGKDQPVAYYSRKLTAPERNYSASELEGLAVVSSVNHFAVYQYGIKFTIETDYRALAFL